MDRIIKGTLVFMASIVAVTGLAIGTTSFAKTTDAAEQVAVKRDEDDVEGELERREDDLGGDEPQDGVGELAAVNSGGGDASRSNDRSRDMTTRDASGSRDRSRDRTGDGVGVNDRSWSKDRSGDRTGDHNSRDVSRSRDYSGDNTSLTWNSNDSRSASA
jgi:hypothetical protein